LKSACQKKGSWKSVMSHLRGWLLQLLFWRKSSDDQSGGLLKTVRPDAHPPGLYQAFEGTVWLVEGKAIRIHPLVFAPAVQRWTSNGVP